MPARCGKPMRRYELPGLPVLEDPSCGLPEGHSPPCRSVRSMAAHAAAQAYRPQAPSGDEAIAAAIVQGRRRAGLSVRRLALAVGVTEAAVAHWERARRTPGERSWVQLEFTLGPLGIVREADPGPEPAAAEGASAA
jgi:hypothetical protein